MLTRTSKKVKEQVRKMRLSAVVRLRGDGAHNDMLTDSMCDLLLPMTAWYSISTLELSSCEVRGDFALYFLARVLLLLKVLREGAHVLEGVLTQATRLLRGTEAAERGETQWSCDGGPRVERREKRGVLTVVLFFIPFVRVRMCWRVC